MENLIVIFIIAAILGGVIGYIYKSKKKGHTCIGCPHADACASRRNGCGCGHG